MKTQNYYETITELEHSLHALLHEQILAEMQSKQDYSVNRYKKEISQRITTTTKAIKEIIRVATENKNILDFKQYQETYRNTII